MRYPYDCLCFVWGLVVVALFDSRRFRKKLIARVMLIIVPVSFLIALDNPVFGLGVLGSAALVALAVFVCLWSVHLAMTAKQERDRRYRQQEAIYRPTSQRKKSPLVDIDLSWQPSANDPGSRDQSHPVDTLKGQDNTEVYSGSNVDDWDEDVSDQLDRLSGTIQSHNLGVYAAANRSNSTDTASREQDSERIVGSQDLIVSDFDTDAMLAMTTPEINQLVDNLQRDKLKLQKLVVAQQASIDAEREAHDRSRILADDAVKIMRDARSAQKTAEKLARRERAERQRVERQYRKVKQALSNAKSIINAREEGVDGSELIG